MLFLLPLSKNQSKAVQAPWLSARLTVLKQHQFLRIEIMLTALSQKLLNKLSIHSIIISSLHYHEENGKQKVIICSLPSHQVHGCEMLPCQNKPGIKYWAPSTSNSSFDEVITDYRLPIIKYEWKMHENIEWRQITLPWWCIGSKLMLLNQSI